MLVNIFISKQIKIMKTKLLIVFLSLGMILSCDAPQESSTSVSSSGGEMDRTILPIQPPTLAKVTVMDARDAEKPPIFSIAIDKSSMIKIKLFNII